MSRPKHPDKHIEALLSELESARWRIARARYYKAKCPCPEKHMKIIHITPSSPHYLKNLISYLERETCFKCLRTTSS